MIFKKLFNLLRSNQNFSYFNFKNKFLIERNNKIKNIFTRLNYIFKSTSWTTNDSINVDKMYNLKNLLKLGIIFLSIIVFYWIIVDLNILQTLIFLLWSSSNYAEFLIITLTTLFLISIKLIFTIILETFHSIFKSDFMSNIYKNTPQFLTVLNDNLVNYDSLIRYEDTLNLVEFNDTKLLDNLTHETGFIGLYNTLYTQPKYNKISVNTQNSLNNVISDENLYNEFLYNYKNLTLIPSSLTQLTKFNLNVENLFITEFKNIEISKWLYKYSIIHSRSFFEAQFLNLKLLPLGNNINKVDVLSTDNIFNFLFNDVTSKYFLYNNINQLNLMNTNYGVLNLSYFNNLNIFKNLPWNYRFFNLKFKNLTTLFYKNNNNILINIIKNDNTVKINSKLTTKIKTNLFYDYYISNKINNTDILHISNVLFYNELELTHSNTNKYLFNIFKKSPYVITNNIIKLKN